MKSDPNSSWGGHMKVVSTDKNFFSCQSWFIFNTQDWFRMFKVIFFWILVPSFGFTGHEDYRLSAYHISTVLRILGSLQWQHRYMLFHVLWDWRNLNALHILERTEKQVTGSATGCYFLITATKSKGWLIFGMHQKLQYGTAFTGFICNPVDTFCLLAEKRCLPLKFMSY